MDLSGQFKHSSTVFSNDGALTLSSSGDRLILRLAETLQIRKTWKPSAASTEASAPTLAFSPCSRRFLACYEALNLVLAFAVDRDEELARIAAGPEGCKGAAWLDEVSLAVWSDHGVRGACQMLSSGPTNWAPRFV
jgi:hypothetical protein